MNIQQLFQSASIAPLQQAGVSPPAGEAALFAALMMPEAEAATDTPPDQPAPTEGIAQGLLSWAALPVLPQRPGPEGVVAGEAAADPVALSPPETGAADLLASGATVSDGAERGPGPVAMDQTGDKRQLPPAGAREGSAPVLHGPEPGAAPPAPQQSTALAPPRARPAAPPAEPLPALDTGPAPAPAPPVGAARPLERAPAAKDATGARLLPRWGQDRPPPAPPEPKAGATARAAPVEATPPSDPSAAENSLRLRMEPAAETAHPRPTLPRGQREAPEPDRAELVIGGIVVPADPAPAAPADGDAPMQVALVEHGATPPSGRAPPTTAPLSEARLPEQIARALPGQPGTVDLVLKPAELGAIRFEIQQSGDEVRMILTAEVPATLDHLRRHLPDLLADLRQAGFAGTDISFGQWSRQEGKAGGQPALPTPVLDDTATPDIAPPPRFAEGAIATRPALSGGRLELRL